MPRDGFMQAILKWAFSECLMVLCKWSLCGHFQNASWWFYASDTYVGIFRMPHDGFMQVILMWAFSECLMMVLCKWSLSGHFQNASWWFYASDLYVGIFRMPHDGFMQAILMWAFSECLMMVFSWRWNMCDVTAKCVCEWRPQLLHSLLSIPTVENVN